MPQQQRLALAVLALAVLVLAVLALAVQQQQRLPLALRRHLRPRRQLQGGSRPQAFVFHCNPDPEQYTETIALFPSLVTTSRAAMLFSFHPVRPIHPNLSSTLCLPLLYSELHARFQGMRQPAKFGVCAHARHSHKLVVPLLAFRHMIPNWGLPSEPESTA